MARGTKAEKSKRAIAQDRYRKRVKARMEPDVRVIDVAATAVLADYIVSATVPGGDRKFYNRLLSVVHRKLTEQGFDAVKSKEAMSRRLGFLAKEGQQPDANEIVRKSWLPPLPSNRPSAQLVGTPETDDDEPF